LIIFLELSQKARGKFIDYINNKGGELGELLLYCFLESHLKAPKILSNILDREKSAMGSNNFFCKLL
jgi:hypothetical protein